MNSLSNKRPAVIPPAIVHEEMRDIADQLCLGDFTNALRQFRNLIRDLSPKRERSRGRALSRELVERSKGRLSNRPPTA